MNKKYTSAWIKTKKTFTYGKIEIRAALPIGKMLSPWIKLVPPRLKSWDGGVRHNQVVVFFNDQSNYIRYDISLGKKMGNVDPFPTNGSLGELHTYSVEWNDSDIVWKFDDIETNRINISERDTFLKNEVILTFYLRVGGSPFRNGAMTFDDVYEWVCSLLILDYVRYYKWVDDYQVQTRVEKSNKRKSVDFCPKIMEEIGPRNAEQIYPVSTQTNSIAIISVICLILLLVLIPLIFWLVIKMNKMRKPERKVEDFDNYYDDINPMDM